MLKIYLLPVLIFTVLIFGCSKTREPLKNNPENKEQQSQNTEDTTEMTPAEAFATSLVQDILNEGNEPELEDYLIENIYPKVSGSPKVTIDRISASLFLLKYYEGSTEKNLLLQKYYNPKEDEIFFESTETTSGNMKQFLK